MKDEEISAAARWDKRYGASDGPQFGAAPNEYLRMIRAHSGFTAGDVLCLADGDGRNGGWLAEQGHAVAAVDISAVASERASAWDRRRGVTVERIVADLETWTPAAGRRWDAVFVFYLHGPAALRRRALQLGAEVLRPGGWLVLEGFSKLLREGAGMGPDNPALRYDLAEVLEACPDLEVVEALAGKVALDEGDRHRGEAEVVRFAARRPV